jgi:hypothetical protein
MPSLSTSATEKCISLTTSLAVPKLIHLTQSVLTNIIERGYKILGHCLSNAQHFTKLQFLNTNELWHSIKESKSWRLTECNEKVIN